MGIALCQLRRGRRCVVPLPVLDRILAMVSSSYRHSGRVLSECQLRALKPPGYHKEWHVGVRVASNKKLVAFIAGLPITLRIRAK